MFRMGGSAAEGITSGLDKPKRGLVDEPGKYSQTLDIPDLLTKTREQMTPENIAAYQPFVQRPEGEALNRFLIIVVGAPALLTVPYIPASVEPIPNADCNGVGLGTLVVWNCAG